MLRSVVGMGDASANAVRILLFAALREQAGWSERHWPTGSGPSAQLTPQELWQKLELPGELSSVRIAINQQFADPESLLQPGDELAFFPPISGG